MDDYNADKERFWKAISGSDTWAQRSFGKNYPAYALFQAISSAFTPCGQMQGHVPVDRELLQYLAGWAQDVVGRQQHHSMNVRGEDGNHFLKRSLDGLFSTVVNAIKIGQIRRFEDGRLMYGCLELPAWLVEKYAALAAKEREEIRAYYEAQGLPCPVEA